MNTVSKRLVIIAIFCLSAAICYAETVATQSMPTVARAGYDAKNPSGCLPMKGLVELAEQHRKSQEKVSVATALQGFRAKAMDTLRGLWGFCKRRPYFPAMVLVIVLDALTTGLSYKDLALFNLGLWCVKKDNEWEQYSEGEKALKRAEVSKELVKKYSV